MGGVRDSYFLELAEQAAEEELVEGSKTKEEKWITMGNHLEISGVPKPLIPASVRDAIESVLFKKLGVKVSIYTTHFYRTMKSQDWGEGDKKIDSPKEVINTSINDDFCDALDTVIDNAKFMREVARTLKDKDGEPLEMSYALHEDTYNAYCHQIRQMATLAKDCANQKLKVPPTMHQLFREILASSAGLLQAGRAFQQVRIDLLENVTSWISSKQAAKVEDLEEANMLPLYIPRDRDMAIFCGWYGLACPECKSWLVKEMVDGAAVSTMRCLNCTHEWRGQTVTHCPRCKRLIYTEDIKGICESERCPKCELYIRLPPSLVQLAG